MDGNARRNGDPFWELQQDYRQKQSFPDNWEPLYFFKWISDKNLLQATCRKFPSGKPTENLSNHPIFLLKRIGNFSYRFCPCSTKNHNNYSYIPAATKPELAPEPFPNNSYICHDIIFSLLPINHMVGPENFYGIVRESDIIGDQYQEGMR